MDIVHRVTRLATMNYYARKLSEYSLQVSFCILLSLFLYLNCYSFVIRKNIVRDFSTYGVAEKEKDSGVIFKE